MTGTRDDEYRDGMRDQARAALEAAAAVSASASAHPADEHHEAQERSAYWAEYRTAVLPEVCETVGEEMAAFEAGWTAARRAHDWDSLDNCSNCGKGFVGDRADMAIENCGSVAESEDHAATVTGERPVIVIIDETRKLDQVPPCARGHHHWAWLTAGGQACGICGALRGEGQ